MAENGNAAKGILHSKSDVPRVAHWRAIPHMKGGLEPLVTRSDECWVAWCFSGLWFGLLCLVWTPVAGRGLHQEKAKGNGAASGGFLSEDLPLKIVGTTPFDLRTTSASLDVEDEQALTVGGKCMQLQCSFCLYFMKAACGVE